MLSVMELAISSSILLSVVTGLNVKVGIIDSNIKTRKMLPTCTESRNNSRLAIEIAWRATQDENLFNISQIGSKLIQEGAVAVFAVDESIQNHPVIDWVLPVSGVGNVSNETCLFYRQCKFAENSSYPETEATYKYNFDGHIGLHVQSNKFSKMLLGTLKKVKWTNAILIYDEETELIINGLSEDLNTELMFFTMYKIDSYGNRTIEEFLDYVYYNISTAPYFVVVCNEEMMQRLLHKANLYDEGRRLETALYYQSQWLLFNLNVNPLDDVSNMTELNNVAVVNIPLTLLSSNIPQYLTLEYMLTYIAERSQIVNQHQTTQCLNESTSAKLFMEIQYLWRQVQNTQQQSTFKIKTLMFHKNGRYWDNVGNTSFTGAVNISSDVFPNARFGFNGRTFHLSTIIYPPFEYLENGTWKGMCIELLDEMKRMLNFTCDISLVPDNEWGRLLNGSWTGLVGQLERKEVDLTVAPLSRMELRERVMDFTLGFMYDLSVILMQKPNPKETQWKRILEPLRWEVIVLTACFVPLVSILLFILEKLTPYHQSNVKLQRLHTHFWYICGCLFMQGGSDLPRSQTERTIVCCWWTFCIVLGATYSGNLIAYLTVNKEIAPFDSLQEMVAQNEYEWGTQGGAYWNTWFEHSDISTLKAVWAGIVKSNSTDIRVTSPSNDIQLQKVREGKYAYIAEKSVLEIIASEDCNLYIAKEEFLPLQYGVGLPNNSPFTKMFSDFVLYMHETGLLKIWKHNNWPKHSMCDVQVLNEAKPVTWIDVQAAFYFLGIGLCICLTFLMIEYIMDKLRRCCCNFKRSLKKWKEESYEMSTVL